MSFDLQKTLKAAQNVTSNDLRISQSVGNGGNRPSVSIVNNVNGKRVSLSSSLVSALNITDSMQVLPIKDLRQFLIAKTLPMDTAITCRLRDSGKAKVAYNADAVQLLTESMRLEYGERTSRAFGEIYIEDVESVPVAVVIVDEASAGTQPTAMTDDEAESA